MGCCWYKISNTQPQHFYLSTLLILSLLTTIAVVLTVAAAAVIAPAPATTVLAPAIDTDAALIVDAAETAMVCITTALIETNEFQVASGVL